MAGFRVAVAGATGLVGRTILQILEERNFPVRELVPLASERSAGRIEERGADQHSTQAGPGRRRDHAADEIGRYHEAGSPQRRASGQGATVRNARLPAAFWVAACNARAAR